MKKIFAVLNSMSYSPVTCGSNSPRGVIMQSCKGSDINVSYHPCDSERTAIQLDQKALLCINNVTENTFDRQFNCTTHPTGFQMPLPDDDMRNCVIKHLKGANPAPASPPSSSRECQCGTPVKNNAEDKNCSIM